MTTPIERAAEAAYDRAFMKHAPEDVDRWSDLVKDSDPAVESWRNVARAVFESIDREGLARLIAEVDISWHAMRGLDGQEQYDITLADAVIAHLTRKDQS